MTAFLLFALLVLSAAGFLGIRRIRTYSDFVVADRSQPFSAVFFSLMATMLGASATIGIADSAARIGTPAFWWLAAGVLGLLLQAALVSGKIRSLAAATLPETAARLAGPAAHRLVAAIVAVSWVGVVAAQFAAMGQVLALASGGAAASGLLLAAAALLVTLYTLIGGQLAILRTDRLQFAVLAAALLAVAAWMQATRPIAYFAEFRCFNEAFPPSRLPGLLLAVGGAYFIGPDIFSRNLVARDPATARRAAFAAAATLAAFALLVPYLGVWCASAPGDAPPLARLAAGGILPRPLAFLLAAGLLAAIISSADTCLFNASTIIAHDLLGLRRISAIRAAIALLGLAALLLALRGGGILSLLLATYSVYSPGVVCPLAVALLAHPRFALRPALWCSAVTAGGALGALGTFLPGAPSALPTAGMALSLLLAVVSLRPATR